MLTKTPKCASAKVAAPATAKHRPPRKVGPIALVNDAVEGSVAVIAEQQRAILRESDIDRTTPDVLFAGGEPDDKIWYSPVGLPSLKGSRTIL